MYLKKCRYGKNLFLCLLSLLLVVSLIACVGGSATNSSSDGDNSNISSSGSSNNNLKSQIKNCKTILEYDNKTYLNEEIDSITFGVDYTNQPIR